MDIPIRVLHIITKLSFGGVQSVLLNYYRHIDKTRVQFDFVVQSEERHVLEDEVLSLGGKIYRLPPMHTERKNFEVELYKLLQEHPEYQIIHAHQNFLNIIPLRIGKKAKVRSRISHSHNNYVASSFSKEFMRKIFKRTIHFYATEQLACSIPAAYWLYGKNHICGKKVKIINNAIDSKEFLMVPEIREKVREDLNISEKFVIIHVGMFGDSKNHEFLLNIFKEFHNKNKDSVLMLIGDGEKRNNLIKLASNYGIKEDVLFLGKRNNVNEYLMAADYFLLPSRNEGLPVVVIEAQASGLHCLVSEAVPEEIDLTGLVKWCSINQSPNDWANHIDIHSRRINTQQKIIEGKYDINYEAVMLEKYYEGL